MSDYAVVWDSRTVTLPAAPSGRKGRDQGFIEKNARATQAVLAAYPDREPGPLHSFSAPALVEVRLIPRPDNHYNPLAVSIAVSPTSDDVELDARHLGFLFDKFLDKIGMRTLHDLARYSADGEIRAQAWIIQRHGLLHSLDLPGTVQLREALRAFLDHPDTPPLTAQPTLLELLDLEAFGTRLTSDTLHLLNTFKTNPQPIADLDVGAVYDGEQRLLRLRDAATDRRVGDVMAGRLYLADERDRPVVLALLNEVGIPAHQPTPVHPAALGDLGWPAERIPNSQTRWFAEGLDFRAAGQRPGLVSTTYAQFNPTTRVLFVEAQTLVAPACIYAARLGLEVADVKVPQQNWRMTDEFWRVVRRDMDMRPKDDFSPSLSLRRGLRAQLPHGLFVGTDIAWKRKTLDTDAYRGSLGEDFYLYEPRVAARKALFPGYELTGRVVACRLCGTPGAELTTPGCASALSYCHRCLDHAHDGVAGERGDALIALRLLAMTEFAGNPPVEEQLARVHLDPEAPWPPADVDVALLARFAIRRGEKAWTLLLAAAGLLSGTGLRTGRGVIMTAMDGHLCLSMQEKVVDDFLHQHGIAHEREPLYPYDEELNPRTRLRGDWLLANGTLVEMWGMPKDPAYAARMREKEVLAARYGIRLVGLTLADIPRLPTIFKPWITRSAAGDELSAWTPPPRPSREPRVNDPNANHLGRNTFNTDVRVERLARCAEAIRLQDTGLTRREIANRLDLNAETVKILLRDGRFYADPSTNSDRLDIAQAAADARKRSMTKAQFQTAANLSAAKAYEAWKDADTLFPGIQAH